MAPSQTHAAVHSPCPSFAQQGQSCEQQYAYGQTQCILSETVPPLAHNCWKTTNDLKHPSRLHNRGNSRSDAVLIMACEVTGWMVMMGWRYTLPRLQGVRATSPLCNPCCSRFPRSLFRASPLLSALLWRRRPKRMAGHPPALNLHCSAMLHPFVLLFSQSHASSVLELPKGQCQNIQIQGGFQLSCPCSVQ